MNILTLHKAFDTTLEKLAQDGYSHSPRQLTPEEQGRQIDATAGLAAGTGALAKGAVDAYKRHKKKRDAKDAFRDTYAINRLKGRNPVRSALGGAGQYVKTKVVGKKKSKFERAVDAIGETGKGVSEALGSGSVAGAIKGGAQTTKTLRKTLGM